MKLMIALIALLAGVFGRAQGQVQGDFALKNVHTGKYVRIKDANSADGTPIVAYSPVNWKCVTWEFKPAADGFYTLVNLFSGKTMQPLNGEAKAGVTMEEQPIGKYRNQLYELIVAGDKQYYVRLKDADLYLTPADANGETNSSIVLQPKKDGDLQCWTLVAQHPTM